MDKLLKTNKKGFTLVELLAVIVILALLIVITANTILPMLNRTKESGMKTYAEKMLSNAQTNLEADKLTTTVSYPVYYKISSKLADGKDDYIGCVSIDNEGKYTIVMYDLDDKLYLSGSGIDAKDIADPSTLETTPYTGKNTSDTATVTAIENLCDAENIETLTSSYTYTAPVGS